MLPGNLHFFQIGAHLSSSLTINFENIFEPVLGLFGQNYVIVLHHSRLSGLVGGVVRHSPRFLQVTRCGNMSSAAAAIVCTGKGRCSAEIEASLGS